MNRSDDAAPVAAAAPVGRTLRRLARYVRPYFREQALCLLFLLGGTVASLMVPLLVRALLDRAIPAHDTGLVIRLAAGMAALHGGYMAAMFATDLFFLRVSNGIVLDLRRDMHDHLMRLSMDYAGGTRAGQILSRIMGDVDAVQVLTTNAFLMLVTDTVSVLVMLVFMVCLSWEMTLVGLGTLALLAVVLRAFNLRILAAARTNREAYARVTEELHEGIAGAREIRAFGRESLRSGLFLERLRAFAGANFEMGIWASAARLLGLLIVAIGPVLVYLMGGASVIRGTWTIGTLVAFVAYMARMYEPVQRLMFLNVQAQSAVGAVERVFSFLDTQPTVRPSPSARPLARARGEIEFRDVTYRYGANGAPPVLRRLSLHVRPGERLALVGPSGAGKSTVAGLILRFFDPEAGRVLLDGTDVRDFDLADLRRQIAFVPQDTFLFHASVAENLRFGRTSASDAELERAARMAHAAAFIAGLPDGYDTVVGERGTRLSGGERQRLSIARAILKDPQIVIFDEATSSLDSGAEGIVKASMDRLMEGRTTIIISHRLATVADADRILVLDDGRIVEEGTHRTLVGRGGLYARLLHEPRGPVPAATA
jgi:ATP-binding cassette subfamily B protein